MARTVEEWIGKDDDTPIPDRVRLRIFERAHGCCEACDRQLRPGDKWQVDHIIPLVAGGANIETNMQILCDWCHKAKTADDVAEKSAVYQKRAKHIGIKCTSRPMPGSRASGWKRTMDGRTVRREPKKEPT